MLKETLSLKKVQIILFIGLFVAGFAVLFIYQNCSKNAKFKSETGLKVGNGDETNDLPKGPSIGGNSDVLIRFREKPFDTTAGGPGSVVDYEVVPNNDRVEIVDVECLLNGVSVDCDQTDRLVFNDLNPGPQTFTIITRTNDPTGGNPGGGNPGGGNPGGGNPGGGNPGGGNPGGGNPGGGNPGGGNPGGGNPGGGNPGGSYRVIIEVVEWTVYNRIVPMTRDIVVTQQPQPANQQVDVIINVDNSGSMEFEQRSMANKISSLITRIQALDYNIAVITTSPSDSEIWTDRLNYVDGKFVPFYNTNIHCLKKSEHSHINTREAIQRTVVRDLFLRDLVGNPIINPDTGRGRPEGSGWERGIFTTYRAFERAQSSSQNTNCLRSGVPKHVILISDERETMEDNEGNPLPDLYKSNGSKLRQLVARLFGANTVFKFHSIIVNPYNTEGASCLNSHGARPGVEYAQLSVDSGGTISSICSSDYGISLANIGTEVVQSQLTYPLGCVAVEYNGTYGNVVNSSGQAISTSYVFRGDKVEFASALTPGTYRVNYYCYSN